MQRIDDDEAKRERRRQQNREANRRWREKNRERVNELNRQWKARNPEKVREAQRRWAAANPEKLAEHRRRYKERHPEKIREKKRRWRERGGYARYYWKNREKCLERIRAYHARQRAIRAHWPAFGALQKAALMANDVYAAVHSVVPTTLPNWLRDDVISEVVLSILDGKAALADAGKEAAAVLRRHRGEAYKHLSLNQPAFEDGPERIDELAGEPGFWPEEWSKCDA